MACQKRVLNRSTVMGNKGRMMLQKENEGSSVVSGIKTWSPVEASSLEHTSVAKDR